MRILPLYLAAISKIGIDIFFIYSVTRGTSPYMIMVLSVSVVIVGLLYEQATLRTIVCREYVDTSGIMMRNFLNSRTNKYDDIGDFVNTIDEYPQNVMFIRKSIFDSAVDFTILIGLVAITPIRFFFYVGIMFGVLSFVFFGIVLLRNLEKKAFPLMNQNLSRFDQLILNVTTHIENVIGADAVDWCVALFSRIGKVAEKKKNDYVLATGLQQTILRKSYILPVLIVLYVAINSATNLHNISGLIVYLVLMSNQVLLVASSVIDAIVSGRYYKDVKDKFIRSPRQEPILIKKLENLSIPINGDLTLSCKDFEINDGDRILIKGSTGSGKTCFVETLMGFRKLQTSETSTQIEFFAKDVKISYVSQSIPIFDLSEEENITLGRKVKWKGNNEFRRFRDELKRRGKNISGGERILVGLNRALVMNPDILILDEIDRNLDFELLQSVIDFCSARIRTILYISHLETANFRPTKIIEVSSGHATVQNSER